MASPIADLSYRNYSGPLEPPVNRWWAIAVMAMRMSKSKKGFWIWSILSALWYVILLAILYFVDSASTAATAVGQQNPFLKNIVWKDQFLNAFMIAQLFMFVLALLIGAGTIANDNRANALLVYLSKPCSKLDYVIGKWLGIFIPLAIVAAVPTFSFYVYCLLSYRNYGFVTQDPWLIIRLFGMVLIPGFFHASVSLGISSMFKQGRLAGATYAGFYFLGVFFTRMMQEIHISQQFNGGSSPIADKLYYCSVDGVQIAMAKIVLHTNGSPLVNPTNQPMARIGIVPEPSVWLYPLAYLAICGLFILLAWSRIRAVEVVG